MVIKTNCYKSTSLSYFLLTKISWEGQPCYFLPFLLSNKFEKLLPCHIMHAEPLWTKTLAVPIYHFQILVQNMIRTNLQKYKYGWPSLLCSTWQVHLQFLLLLSVNHPYMPMFGDNWIYLSYQIWSMHASNATSISNHLNPFVNSPIHLFDPSSLVTTYDYLNPSLFQKVIITFFNLSF
jgi:hypothetical protein